MTAKTDAVRTFYLKYPYPSYGAQVKQRFVEHYERYCAEPGRYLEAGCGTGHIMTGNALSLPHLEFHAIDLSENSIAVAKKVTEENGVKVDFRVHNMMEPLPFDFTFRYIHCVGVIMCLETPEVGLRNLVERLDDDGYLFLHAYGEDYHRRRFQIMEMLDILQQDDDDDRARFGLFAAYAEHHKRLKRGSLLRRLYRLSPRDIILPVMQSLRARSQRYKETSIHTWYDELEHPEFSERWMDQFAHPHERSYNLSDFCDLLDTAGLEPLEMFSVGKFRPEHLPPGWQPGFDRLPKRDQYRVMELLNPAPTSPFCVARKRRG